MTVKASGIEVKAFYSDPEYWPEGVWHEDEILEIDGILVEEGSVDLSIISDTCIVSISDGYVTNKEGKDLGSFEKYFKRWRKSQDSVFLLIEIKKNNIETMELIIKSNGGKIIGTHK